MWLYSDDDALYVQVMLFFKYFFTGIYFFNCYLVPFYFTQNSHCYTSHCSMILKL